MVSSPGPEPSDGVSELALVGAPLPPPTPTRDSIADAARSLGALAGVALVVTAVGGIVTWSRLHGAGVPADEAFSVVPKQEFLVVGARQLLLPAMLGLFFYWLQLKLPPSSGRSGSVESQQRESGDGPVAERLVWLLTRRPMLSLLRGAVRSVRAVWRVGGPVLRPIFRFQAKFPYLVWWLPFILIARDPFTQALLLANSYGSSEIGSRSWRWHAEMPAPAARWRAMLLITLLSAVVGLISEWHLPKQLPAAHVARQGEADLNAGFIADNGGELYLASGRRLLVLDSGSYKSLTVAKAQRRHDNTSRKSLATRLLEGLGL